MEITIIAAMEPQFPVAGGMEFYVENIILNLMKEDIKVSLIGISHGEHKIRTDYDFVALTKKDKVSGYEYFIRLLFKARSLKISKNSIIHSQRPDHMFPFVIFNKKNSKICTLHGTAHRGIHYKQGKLVGIIYGLIEKFTLKRVDKLIVVDEGTRDYYLERYHWLKDKIIVIPVGVDTEKFKPMDKEEVREEYGFKKSEKIILYVGRLEKEKRLDLLIESFKEVKNKIEDAKLVLVGDGREKEKLEKIVKELDLRGITFLGVVNHDKLPRIMNCADVFVLISCYEGMPTVVLESLACGIPVVSTDVGDVHKVVKNGGTGYLIDEENLDDISTMIISILKGNNTFKEDCVNIAQMYSWDKISKRIIEVYDEIHCK